MFPGREEVEPPRGALLRRSIAIPPRDPGELRSSPFKMLD